MATHRCSAASHELSHAQTTHEATFLREELAAIDRAAVPSVGSGDGGVSDPPDRGQNAFERARGGSLTPPLRLCR